MENVEEIGLWGGGGVGGHPQSAAQQGMNDLIKDLPEIFLIQ